MEQAPDIQPEVVEPTPDTLLRKAGRIAFNCLVAAGQVYVPPQLRTPQGEQHDRET